jgi:methyl-accepting chemotaxis protein
MLYGMKNRISRILFVLCILAFRGVSAGAEPFGTIVPANWTITLPASEERVDSLPLRVRTEKPDNEDVGIVVSCDFDLPDYWTAPLGIMLYKNNMACRVYVNEVYIDTLGRSGQRFFFQPYISRGVLVPASVLKAKNTLRLELWNDTGAYKLRMVDFMDEVTYRDRLNLFNFLDVQLPRFACVLLLFVALYSMFQYLNYREKKESLLLSLCAFFFALYLFNVTVFSAGMSYVTLKAILYAAFPISMIFLFFFFNRFLRMKLKPLPMRIILGVGALLALGYFIQGNTATLDTWHSVMLIYPVGALAFGIWGVFTSKEKTFSENIPILVGILAAFGFSGYDIYFFVTDRTPVVLMQGIGFMSLIIGTFYSFSKEIADTNKKCALFAEEMELNRAQRESLFEKIRQNTIRSEASSSKLDQSIERVGSLMSQYLTSIEQINANIATQSAQVRSNKNEVEKIFRAIGETTQLVGRHERLVGETVSNVRELNDGIRTTDRLVRQSGETVKKLTSVSLAADRDVAESARFVDDLANYSSNINEIVTSISSLAEQTNILSINAAIEAARSGQMGKGFAVVAGEIRSLATKSGASAAQINEILGTMVEKIRNIQAQEQQVSARLKAIVGENRTIESAMAEVFRELEEQQSRSGTIAKTVDELIGAVRLIAEQTGAQRASGEDLGASLELLESITQSIVTASDEQKQCNEELKSNLALLRTVSEDNLDVVTNLKKLIS